MSVTAAQGFDAAGVSSGIKTDGSPDVAVVVGVPGTVAAAVFTTNRAAAAPVMVSRTHLAAGPETRAVVLNSGCANAATGSQGVDAAEVMVNTTAAALGCDSTEVLVCSTGLIGSRLPIGTVEKGIAAAVGRLANDDDAGNDAAAAILTTDSQRKQGVRSGPGYVVGGMAKGAGMIRPNMATMLAVITTDAVVDTDELHTILRSAVDHSFNLLDIDGCESTNDTVILMASGASGVKANAAELALLVEEVCVDLARQIAEDAEGASRLIDIEVAGAATDRDAAILGRAVADSALVRAAFHGGDPNWGRVLAALGTTTVEYDPAAVSVTFGGVLVSTGSESAEADEDAIAEQLASGDFTVQISVGDGPGAATVLTTDLTADYVRFNAERS